MSKKGTGDWKPLPPITNEPVPAQGTTRVGYATKRATLVLPIDPHTLQMVPEKQQEEE